MPCLRGTPGSSPARPKIGWEPGATSCSSRAAGGSLVANVSRFLSACGSQAGERFTACLYSSGIKYPARCSPGRAVCGALAELACCPALLFPSSGCWPPQNHGALSCTHTPGVVLGCRISPRQGCTGGELQRDQLPGSLGRKTRCCGTPPLASIKFILYLFCTNLRETPCSVPLLRHSQESRDDQHKGFLCF